MAKEPLSQRRELMIDFYLAGSTKADAMRLAGYSENSATTGQDLVFNHPVVLKELKRRQEENRKEYKLDEDWVIQRLMRLVDSGSILAKFKKVLPDGKLDWDFTGATEDDLACINELTVGFDKEGRRTMKIGTESIVAAADKLMRKLGSYQDVTINIGEVTLSDRIDRGRERSRLANKKPGDDAVLVNGKEVKDAKTEEV